jgi:hypothetical protein
MTTLLASIGDEKIKGVRDYDSTIYLQICAAQREIMDGAVDFELSKEIVPVFGTW